MSFQADRVDSVDLYLHDVGGNGKREKWRRLTKEQERDLALRIRQGDLEARNELVEANLPYAISVAKSFQDQGLELADLIQAANEGMLVAAGKFDPSKFDVKFISYAVWWVRQSIMTSLNVLGAPLHIPEGKALLRKKFRKAEEKHLLQYGKRMSTHELAALFRVRSKDVEILSGGHQRVSLDDPVPSLGSLRGFGQRTVHSVLPDSSYRADEFDERDHKDTLRKTLEEMIISLSVPTRDKEILIDCFRQNGDGESPSLDAIGMKYGISRERVRQRRDRALKALRVILMEDPKLEEYLRSCLV